MVRVFARLVIALVRRQTGGEHLRDLGGACAPGRLVFDWRSVLVRPVDDNLAETKIVGVHLVTPLIISMNFLFALHCLNAPPPNPSHEIFLC